MKILSDFDGVWTNQGQEAKHIERFTCAEIARVTGEPLDAVRHAFDDYIEALRRTPQDYGWAPNGRISAYVDEDPLLTTNSVFLVIMRALDETSKRWGQAIRAAGFEALEAFADHCFLGATKIFRRDHDPIMVEAAAETMRALLAKGAEVVVVSNSRSDKLIAWLGDVGIDAGEGPGHEVRVRGNAKKWALSDAQAEAAPCIEVAGRRVYVDRPFYDAVFTQEAPDLVIGDVFSLDLALPSVLRARNESRAPSTLVLRAHPHTPAWIRETRAEGRIDHLVDHPRGLLDLF